MTSPYWCIHIWNCPGSVGAHIARWRSDTRRNTLTILFVTLMAWWIVFLYHLRKFISARWAGEWTTELENIPNAVKAFLSGTLSVHCNRCDYDFHFAEIRILFRSREKTTRFSPTLRKWRTSDSRLCLTALLGSSSFLLWAFVSQRLGYLTAVPSHHCSTHGLFQVCSWWVWQLGSLTFVCSFAGTSWFPAIQWITSLQCA